MKHSQFNKIISTGDLAAAKRALSEVSDELDQAFNDILLETNDISHHPLCHATTAEMVQFLIDCGADDLETVDTPVLIGMIRRSSAAESRVNAVQSYVNKIPCELNADWDEDGRYAIHVAANTGDVELIDFLINAGANLMMFSNDGETAIGIAVDKNDLKMVEKLLSLGVSFSSEDYDLPPVEECDDIEIEDPAENASEEILALRACRPVEAA